MLSQVDASSDFRLVEPYETSKNDRMTGEIVGQRTTGLEIVRHSLAGITMMAVGGAPKLFYLSSLRHFSGLPGA